MEKTYNVTGMGCASCSAHVGKAVGALDGVSQVNVDLEAEKMNVSFDESAVDFDTIKQAVEEAGYGLERD